MDTNVQALKNLYVALGGEASDVADLTTSSEVITAMESVAASAASELPAVKPADNGSILKVSGGKWSKGKENNGKIYVVINPSNNQVVTVTSDLADWNVNTVNNVFNLRVEMSTVTIDGTQYLSVRLPYYGCSLSGTTSIYYFGECIRLSGKTAFLKLVIPSTYSRPSDATFTVDIVADPSTVPEA